MPPSEEAKLGDQVKAEVLKQYPALPDPQAQQYVQSLGQQLAVASEAQRQVPVHFTVVDAPNEVNAFATPGGNIFVTSGLLMNVQNENELAGVLAHEIGHVTHRDVAQQLVAQYGLEALAAAVMGVNSSLPAQIATSLAGKGLLLKYTRDQESAADAAAVQTLAQEHRSARGMVNFFDRLAEEQGQTPAVLAYFQTHPQPGDRARTVEADAKRLGAWTAEPPPTQAFVSMRQGVGAYYAARKQPKG